MGRPVPSTLTTAATTAAMHAENGAANVLRGTVGIGATRKFAAGMSGMPAKSAAAEAVISL